MLGSGSELALCWLLFTGLGFRVWVITGLTVGQ
jgi:hypothetical protein